MASEVEHKRRNKEASKALEKVLGLITNLVLIIGNFTMLVFFGIVTYLMMQDGDSPMLGLTMILLCMINCMSLSHQYIKNCEVKK